MAEKPKSLTKELAQADEQFKAFDNNIKEMTLDRMNEAPKQDCEPQNKLSQREIHNSKDVYLKPFTVIGSTEKFNEKFREDYNFAKEYVQFIPEHKECIGDVIELWTKPFPGVGAEFWKIPTGKPVWGPRYLAEKLNRTRYHRFVMQNQVTNADGLGQYYGSMAVDTTIQRMDAVPVSSRKSIYMGKSDFEYSGKKSVAA